MFLLKNINIGYHIFNKYLEILAYFQIFNMIFLYVYINLRDNYELLLKYMKKE